MSVYKKGQKYNRLTLIRFERKNKYHHSFWLCKCDCGTEKIVNVSQVKSGAIKSCGCLNKELSRKRLMESTQTHGYANKERLYDIWKNMKRRCYDKSNKRYENYGGKGVIVCDEWKNDYLSFRKWAYANGYNDELTIDRIDVNGNYEPSNCKWSSWKEQMNNQTRNRFLAYKGKTMTMSQWAELLGLTYGAMNHRVQRGWSMERIVNTPLRTSSNKGDSIVN